MIVLTKNFVPYQPFDLDQFLKVTTAILILTMSILNLGTNILEATDYDISGKILFGSLGSTKIHGRRSL